MSPGAEEGLQAGRVRALQGEGEVGGEERILHEGGVRRSSGGRKEGGKGGRGGRSSDVSLFRSCLTRSYRERCGAARN